MQKRLYMIDLFCGAGGVSEGAIQAGFYPIFSSDISVDVEKTYVNRHNQLGLIQNYNAFFYREDIKNLNGKFILDKISKLPAINKTFDKGDIDLVFGGPSCQGFSMIGKRDKKDPRNMLFKEYIRLISEIKPKYAVMENVVGFMSFSFCDFESLDGYIYPDGTTAPEILKREFNLIGYKTLEPKILLASNYGVPQNRKRAIFIAYKEGQEKPNYPQPIIEVPLTLADGIKDLNEQKPTKYAMDSIKGRTISFITNKTITRKSILNNELPFHNDIIKERFSLYQEGENTIKLRERIKLYGIDISNKPNLIALFNDDLIVDKFKEGKVSDFEINILLTKKNIRTKLRKDKPSNTIVTIADDYISPFDNRTFTVRELARLQSFDDSFEFLGKRTTGGKNRQFEVPQYTQVGNAVPPLMAKAICLEIKKCL